MPTTDSFFPFLTTSCVCSAHICQLLVRFMSRQTGFKWLLLHTFATHCCVSCLARRITSGFYRVYLPVAGTFHALPDAHSFARSLAHSRARGKEMIRCWVIRLFRTIAENKWFETKVISGSKLKRACGGRRLHCLPPIRADNGGGRL